MQNIRNNKKDLFILPVKLIPLKDPLLLAVDKEPTLEPLLLIESVLAETDFN